MENIMYKPVIGVVMCRNRLKGHQTQTLQEKYLNAIERRRRTDCPAARAGRAGAAFCATAETGRHLSARQPEQRTAAPLW